MIPIKRRLLQAFFVSKREPLGETFAREINKILSEHLVHGRYGVQELAEVIRSALRLMPRSQRSVFFKQLNPAAYALAIGGPLAFGSYVDHARHVHEVMN